MNKVTLSLTCMLMACAICVNAQTDSVRSATEHPSMHPPNEGSSTQYHSEDRVSVTPAEVPMAIRKTLDGTSKYAGWRKSKIYFDKSTNEYSFDLMDGNILRTYRFNQTGEVNENTPVKTKIQPSSDNNRSKADSNK